MILPGFLTLAGMAIRIVARSHPRFRDAVSFMMELVGRNCVLPEKVSVHALLEHRSVSQRTAQGRTLFHREVPSSVQGPP